MTRLPLPPPQPKGQVAAQLCVFFKAKRLWARPCVCVCVIAEHFHQAPVLETLTRGQCPLNVLLGTREEGCFRRAWQVRGQRGRKVQREGDFPQPGCSPAPGPQELQEVSILFLQHQGDIWHLLLRSAYLTL